MASPEFYKLVERIKARRPTTPRTLAQSREDMELVGSKFTPPAGVTLAPVDAGGVPAEWTVPATHGATVILYLHGGGYSIGSIATHRNLVGNIALAAGARVLSLGYRLAPEHPFPAAVDDAVAAARWLRAQGVAKLVLSGDSAGGGLAIAAALALRDAGDPLPAAIVALSPFTDLAVTGQSMESCAALDPMVQRDGIQVHVGRYAGTHDPKTPLISPLYADLKGLPPMLIQVGSWETLLDDSTRLAERARAAGVTVELEVAAEMIHVWQYYADMIPEGRVAIEQIGHYVRAHTG